MSKSDSDFEDGVELKHGSGVGIASEVGYLGGTGRQDLYPLTCASGLNW